MFACFHSSGTKVIKNKATSIFLRVFVRLVQKNMLAAFGLCACGLAASTCANPAWKREPRWVDQTTNAINMMRLLAGRWNRRFFFSQTCIIRHRLESVEVCSAKCENTRTYSGRIMTMYTYCLHCQRQSLNMSPMYSTAVHCSVRESFSFWNTGNWQQPVPVECRIATLLGYMNLGY